MNKFVNGMRRDRERERIKGERHWMRMVENGLNNICFAMYYFRGKFKCTRT